MKRVKDEIIKKIDNIFHGIVIVPLPVFEKIQL